MTDLRTLLEERKIRKAVIIDDVFDDAPRPDELDEGDWSTFFDDLGEEGHRRLADLFSEYELTNQSDLQSSQEFIDILWANRQALPEAPMEALFRDYESSNATERTELEKLVHVLEFAGLTCTRMGRDLSGEADDADLIVIDLFLGRRQSRDDMARAVQRARDLVKERMQCPPLVILTSKSTRLNDNRDVFRDDSGLLGSTFRVASKSSLAKDGVLESILVRLAGHYEDAKRVAGFVHAWDNGLNHARKNFVRLLRRLDLSDLAQVRALLLDFEGERLGDYLFDIADRVLQHEIEGNDDTIGAALELNKIDLGKYPAPHLIGTPDLQELVYRMIFMHKERLRLAEDKGKPQPQFGDLLRWKKPDDGIYGDDVALVVTPACDLVRGGAKRIMLLAGKLKELQPRDWSYKADPVRTAIIMLPDEGRRWIRWSLKDVRTLSWDELDGLFGKGERLRRIGRLRETYAIEIQQMLLADLGRIGPPANMPVPFLVAVTLFYVDGDCKARKLGVGDSEVATCYVGRGESPKPVHHLVLTEQTCDQIEQALQALAVETVRKSARASLTAAKGDREFITRFERGEVEISAEKGTMWIKGADNKIYAAIVRSEEFVDGATVSGDSRTAAIIIKVADIPEQSSRQGVS